MEKLPAKAGWQWIKEGFALFRKQPAALSTLFLSYMLLMVVLGIVPVIGQVLPLVLVPIFAMVFMEACLRVEQGKRVPMSLLFAGFRSPAIGPLLKLGGLYLVAAVLAAASSSLIDGGVFWKGMTGQMPFDEKTVQGSNMALAMLFAAALYTPAAMGFWYAAPLVAWQKMGVAKAIFYSFFAVLRAGKAFLVYGLGWILIGVLLPVIFSTLLAMVTGKAMVTMLVLMPLSLVMTVIMYCSFYPMYTQVFGQPEAPPPTD
ncbi:MAG: BPSS1780 family membrane protein [Pseudomonadota bacterium]